MTAQAYGQTRVELNGRDITEFVDVVLQVKFTDPDLPGLLEMVWTNRLLALDGSLYLLTGYRLDMDDGVCLFQTRQVAP